MGIYVIFSDPRPTSFMWELIANFTSLLSLST